MRFTPPFARISTVSFRHSLLQSLVYSTATVAIVCLAPPRLEAQPLVSTTSAWDGSAALPLLSRDFSPTSIGQTFTTPSDAAALNEMTVFLGYAPFFFPNDLDLRFHAYLFGWNGSALTNLLWRSPVQHGATDLPLEPRMFNVGGIPLVAGSQYAIVLSTLEADPFDVSGAFITSFPAFQNVGVVDADAYGRGTLIQSFEADWSALQVSPWLSEPAADLAIELRFAPRGVVVAPEPSTGLLVAPAVALLALRIRRRATSPTLE
jgi:hypothetical protein